MNSIFKYNGNANHSTEDVKGGYTGNNISLLNVYLNVKGLSVKIQLKNIFKDHHIVAYSVPTAVGYGKWKIFLSLWKRFYYGHDKYKLELSEYFKMYQFQLNLSMLCATRALGIS